MIGDVFILFGATLVGFIVIVLIFKGHGFIDLEKRKQEAGEIIKKADAERIKIEVETKERVERFKERSQDGVEKAEERIEKRKQGLEHKEKTIKKKGERLEEEKNKIKNLKEEIEGFKVGIINKSGGVLETLSKKSGEEIEGLKGATIERYKNELEEDNIKKLKQIEEDLKENAQKIAENIIISAIQRTSSPTSVETRAVHIKVPRDEMKGVIVGTKGENILELEERLKVAIVFNDLPQTISVSSFNLVDRRIAQITLEKLVREKKGINKETISRTIKSAEKETAEELLQIGKNAVEELGINHKCKNEELLKIIGRLKYRTSYGQNILKHSAEMAWLATMMGSEIGLNTETCKVSAFLHDLGKAVDQDPTVQDAHDQLTKEIMEKYGFTEEEVHAAWTHHDAEPQKTAEALLVKAADSISGGRPGARAESIHSYNERIKALLETGGSFEGVEKIFAMSAGRELRLIVDPKKIQDDAMGELARRVANKIEDEITYPGKIKVNIIRKIKHTEIARKQ